MMTKHKFLSIFFIPILALAIIGGCGGGGSDDGGGSAGGPTSNEMIVVEGTIADVVANAVSTDNSFLLARIFNYIKPTLHAFAQEEEMDDLSGITVIATDGTDTFGPVVTDADGNFTIELPCETALTFTFTTEDSQSIDFGEIQFPCPEVGATETTVFLTVTLDLNDDGETEVDVEEEEMPDSAAISCEGQEGLEIIQGELIVEGNGGPCIISSGGCEISVEAGLVSLTGCSNCIDTRGNSSVEIEAESFECIAEDTGIRSVGSSSVDIDVEIAVIMDGTEIPTDATMQTAEEADLFISAGNTGVDARGNSNVELEADVDDSDMMDGTMMSSNSALIAILGGENSISAVGNSEVEVEADECILDPSDIEVKGNAEVEIDCDNTDSDEDSDSDSDSDLDEDSDSEEDEEDSDSDSEI